MIINKETTLNKVINQLNELDIKKTDLLHLIDIALKNRTKNLYFNICYDLTNEHFKYAITSEENLRNPDPTKYNYSFFVYISPFLPDNSIDDNVNLFEQKVFKEMLFCDSITHYRNHLKKLQASIFKALARNSGKAIYDGNINNLIENNAILATDYYSSLDDYKKKSKSFDIFAWKKEKE